MGKVIMKNDGRMVKWEPFRPASKPGLTIKNIRRRFGVDKATAKALIERERGGQVFINNIYQVDARPAGTFAGFPDLIWLSIKRRDREPIHDWRDLQRIKNELVGPEHEAVELYPAESRLIDTSNQYHLYILAKSGQRFPFGMFDGRCIQTPEQAAAQGAKQRAYDKGA